MTQPLATALARVRSLVLDPATFVRAVASGHQRGQRPGWRRAELRYVDLKAGRALQVTALDDTQAHTTNHAIGDAAAEAVDALIAQTRSIERAVSALGLDAIAFEGSDSLDNPDAVFQ